LGEKEEIKYKQSNGGPEHKSQKEFGVPKRDPKNLWGEI
jgi:hypothetical protein